MNKSRESSVADDTEENARNYGADIGQEPGGRGKQKGEAPQAENEVVDDIVEQAKEVQRVAEKIYFLSILKRFGLAFGGILLLLGTVSLTLFLLLFFDVFSTGFSKNVELVIEIGLALISVIHILAGFALLAG